MLIRQSCQSQSCMLGSYGRGLLKMHVSDVRYPISVLKTQVNSIDTTHSVAINFYVGSTLDIW